MAKQIQVVSVGPDIHVQGGISRVIEMISTRIPAGVRFRHVPTFTKYTGAEGLDPSQRGSRLGQGLVYVAALASILKAAIGRRTVFHVHFAGRGSLIRKGLLCGVLRTLRCTYVVHSHAAETNLFQPWLPQVCRRLLLWGLGGADRVIVLTQFWSDYYRSLLGLPTARLTLLPNPAHLPETVPERLHHGALRLLFLGRVGQRKGAFDLIRAFAQLPGEVRKDCFLTVAGDGELDAAASLARQSGCSERIDFRGWVGANEVDSLLRDSDVLLLPSHAEGMSMALIEAMSWALPVVTTSAGGAQAFLEHGRNSILIAPGDVEGISRAIEDLYHNPRGRIALGLAARETVSQFSIESYMAKLASLYEELAASRIDRRATAVAAETTSRPLQATRERTTSMKRMEPAMTPKMNILGLQMDCLSYDDMHRMFREWLSDKESPSHTLALINVNCCVSALFDKRLVGLYNSADILGVDGMPFLRWARAFYNKKADRFYAPDLMLETSRKAKEYGYTFFLYGGSPGAPDKMEAYLRERFEGINIVGKYSPPFRALSEEEDRAICEMINAAKPDILWVGLGSPKQDVWISEHRNKIRGTIMIASGATFDFFSGRIKQAPEWIRNAGFEWLYRLTKDFRRLWVRYTVYNVVFVFMFVLQLIGLKRFETADQPGTM